MVSKLSISSDKKGDEIGDDADGGLSSGMEGSSRAVPKPKKPPDPSFIGEDLSKVLSEGPWFFRGQALLLIPWRPNFQPMRERIEVIPVWVQLPELPLEYLQKDILINIAKSIGQPIKLDGFTLRGQRAKYARIYLLWNLSSKLRAGIWINGGGSSFWQAIAFENVPRLCSYCGKIGHLEDNCIAKSVPVCAEEKCGGIKDGQISNQDVPMS
ncbi:hypothetical protein Cni_G11020 [Canna indica]|uniref:CCHC-type domain-containing protein n=1 Tax=Canna indica TaxID=4628 RepID=A0AAQ3Q7T3_9LILI|nr:hypothetical protein Cni_G11020 [Canna indica]